MIQKKVFLLLLSLVLSICATAQNISVAGTQNGAWSADSVFVTGDIFVSDTLDISAGTKVIFCGEYTINVSKAVIRAIGAQGDSIDFICSDTTDHWRGFNIHKSVVKLSHCTFRGSKADNETRHNGGAFYIQQSSALISNCTFETCFAHTSGGAIYAIESEIQIDSCHFADNRTNNDDDAIYTYGAGVCLAGCNATFNSVVFSGNSCDKGCGGGLCIDSTSATISRCIFEDNYATNGGGVSCIRSDDRPVSIDNVLVTNNTVTHYAGGIHIAQCYNVSINNATICDNTSLAGGGGAMQFHLGSKAYINNSIIWGNVWGSGPHEDGEQIWIWDIISTPEFRNCILQGGIETIHHYENITIAENVIDTDPLFNNATQRNYHLTQQSPCRNGGNTELYNASLPLIDLDGNNRVSGDNIDMGAYEFQEELALAQHYNSTIEIRPIFSNGHLKSVYAHSANNKHLTMSIFDINGTLLWRVETIDEDYVTIPIRPHFATQMIVIMVDDGTNKAATKVPLF